VAWQASSGLGEARLATNGAQPHQITRLTHLCQWLGLPPTSSPNLALAWRASSKLAEPSAGDQRRWTANGGGQRTTTAAMAVDEEEEKEIRKKKRVLFLDLFPR